MRIGMVEDSPMDTERLKSVLQEYADKMSLSYELESFSTGMDFLRHFKAGMYDLIFLDNYIGSMMGMEIAEKIRLSDMDVAIVFVTMSPDFAVEGFAVQALHYIIKPVNMSEMEQVFQRYAKLRPAKASAIEVLSDRHKTPVKISDIVYVEILQKACNIHTRTEVHKTYQGIEQLEEQVRPFDYFLRPHRSYLVNMRFIDHIEEDQFILTTGDTVPIRHNGRAEVRRVYMHFLLRKEQYS